MSGMSSASIPTLRTERVILRPWRDDDVAPFAELNRDPEVMRFFPSVLDREQSDAMVARIRTRMAEDGFGLWEAEVPGVAPFIGFIGLARPNFDAHFTPAVEVGWRLDRRYWGRGYAPEGARAAVAHGFDVLGLDEIVSMTIPANLPSQRVMQKLGMTRDPSDDFDHPNIADGPVRPHLLYRLRRADWMGSAPTR
jgi:RimJ/RimL family protein N-acetyltransferase